MDRAEKSKEKYRELFHKEPSQGKGNDPEFREILEKFVFGELWFTGKLSSRIRELISVTVLTAIQTMPQLELHVGAALNAGCRPIEIREAVYQCAPYIGFPKTINALTIMNQVFVSRGINLPMESMKKVQEEKRFEKGLAVEDLLYGDEIEKSTSWLPGEYGEALPRFLTEFCFGDFYTRDGLILKDRSLLLVILLTAIGSGKSQIRRQVAAALKSGNSREEIAGALIQATPYMGIPIVIDALNTVRDYLEE